MIKIGDFALLADVSVRSLRHYDKLNLIKPAYINQDNGHRYYTLDQLTRLNRLIALKNLGIPLKQLEALLNADVSESDLRGMLLLRKAELKSQMQEAQQRLNGVEMRLHQIEDMGRLHDYDVIVKSIPQQPIVSLREHINTGHDIPSKFDKLYRKIQPLGINIQQAVGLFHRRVVPKKYPCSSLPYSVAPDALECAFIVDATKSLNLKNPFATRELPAVEAMATVLYQGAYLHRGAAVLALYRWAENNNTWFKGPIREIYLQVKQQDAEHPDNLVEIQFPLSERQTYVS